MGSSRHAGNWEQISNIEQGLQAREAGDTLLVQGKACRRSHRMRVGTGRATEKRVS